MGTKAKPGYEPNDIGRDGDSMPEGMGTACRAQKQTRLMVLKGVGTACRAQEQTAGHSLGSSVPRGCLLRRCGMSCVLSRRARGRFFDSA